MRTIALKMLRWGFGAGLFALALWLIGRIPSSGPSAGAIFIAVGVVALICVSALIFIPEAYRLLVGPLGWMIDQVYMPGGKLKKPILSYNLPRYYRKSRRYLEALERYQLILDHYPDEETARREIIELLALDLGDWAQAERRKDEALRYFKRNAAVRVAVLDHWEQLKMHLPAGSSIDG